MPAETGTHARRRAREKETNLVPVYHQKLTWQIHVAFPSSANIRMRRQTKIGISLRDNLVVIGNPSSQSS